MFSELLWILGWGLLSFLITIFSFWALLLLLFRILFSYVVEIFFMSFFVRTKKDQKSRRKKVTPFFPVGSLIRLLCYCGERHQESYSTLPYASLCRSHHHLFPSYMFVRHFIRYLDAFSLKLFFIFHFSFYIPHHLQP